jgi:DNA-binding GntR family transcriptional regulator
VAKLKKIGNPKALGELTYESLKEAIIAGKFHPGNWLSEAQITEALGVSRTPVREAFKQLQSEGLIEIFPRKGAYIVPLTESDIANLFDGRIVLETAFFERSARKLNKDKLEQFKNMFKAAEGALSNVSNGSDLLKTKWNEYLKVDRSFHDELVKASDNPFWFKLYLNTRNRMQIFGYRMWKMPEQMAALTKQHNMILASMLAKKYAEAKKRLIEHLEYVRDVFLKNV